MRAFLSKEIHPSWAIVLYSVGIILGAIFGLVFRIVYFSSLIWVFVSLVLLVFTLIFSKRGFLIFAVISGMILVFFRISGELYGNDYVRRFFGQSVVVSGIVKDDPVVDESGMKIKLVKLEFGEGKASARGSVYILARFNRDVSRGDIIEVSGKISEGFGTFSGYMYKPNIAKILKQRPGDLILRIRNWFSERIIGLIPGPEVNLGLSYLLGMKSGLPKELDENLRVVGLVHIVVASGAHLSILVEIARRAFGKVSRFFGLFTSTIFILFFMAMVGWTPSILRAGIMTILSLVAWYVGREIAAWRLILIVAAFTLMLNPNFLFDLGWLLSFASFSGIMILGPILKRIFYGDKKPGFISSIIITTVSATLMTLPITLYFYGTVSLISVLANLLVLPTLPYAMGFVFLSGLVVGVPGVDIIASFLATKLLSFHITVVEFFGGMREFLIEIPINQLGVFLIYVFIALVLLYAWWRKYRRHAIMKTWVVYLMNQL